MAYSGEGNLIEGQIEGDPDKTVIPVAVDSDGHLIIDLDASTITIGTVDQGASGTDPWSVKIDQTGSNNDVDATITNFPANQNVTVTNGSGGSAVNIQDGGNSITVDGPLTDAQLRASPVPVTDNGGSLTIDGTVSISGSVAVTGPLTDTQLRAVPVPISGTVTATGPLTDTQLRATPVPISGTVTATPTGTQDVNIISTIAVPVTDNGGSLTVDGVFFQATQPVSGPLTDTQLRATPVPISGTVTITDGSGPVTVDGTVAATQSGTWTVQPGNTANTTAWKVDGSAVTQPISAASLPLPSGAATSALQTQPGVDIGDVTVNNGTGAAAVNIQDGGNSLTVDGTITANQGTSPWVTSLASTTITGNVTVVQPTGTNLHTVLDSGTLTSITNALPAGTNVLGHVITDSGSTTVVTGNVTVVQPTGSNLHIVPDGTSTASVAQVVLTANTSATLLASNANRKQAILFTTNQPVYVKYGTTASTTSFTYKITANNTTLEMNNYTGRIDIMSQAGQTVNITEVA